MRDEGSMILRNVGILPHHYTASQSVNTTTLSLLRWRWNWQRIVSNSSLWCQLLWTFRVQPAACANATETAINQVRAENNNAKEDHLQRKQTIWNNGGSSILGCLWNWRRQARQTL